MNEIKVLEIKEITFGEGMEGGFYRLENKDIITMHYTEVLELAETGAAKTVKGKSGTIYKTIQELHEETGKYHIYSFDRVEGKMSGFEADKKYTDNKLATYTYVGFIEESELHHFVLNDGNGFKHVKLTQDELYKLQLR